MLDLTIYQEIRRKSIEPRVVYPTIYGMFSDGGSVTLVPKNDDENTRRKYKKILEYPYYSSANNRVIVEKLIILSLAGDEKEYCSLVKNFVGRNEILNEIETSINFPMIKCKEL